jgi:hypothetical protein
MERWEWRKQWMDGWIALFVFGRTNTVVRTGGGEEMLEVR